MKKLFFCLFLFVPLSIFSQQSLEWWDQLHNYPDAAGDQRSRYVNVSPGYMGPNAFFIPAMPNMLIDNEFWLQVSGQFHRGNGDQTNNLFLQANLPLAKDRVRLYITSVPLEWWQVTPETRDERRMQEFDGRGTNTGDITYGFVFKVLRENKWLPFNFGMRVHAKTTTGGQLINARFTDNSLFQWEGNFSKTLIDRENEHLMVKWALGFVTWQTNRNHLPGGSQYLQNDAPYYGAGVEYTTDKWFLGTDVTGYSGYMGNRDYPHFWRNQLQYRSGKLALRVEYNYGLQSWDWNTFLLGLRYYMATIQD